MLSHQAPKGQAAARAPDCLSMGKGPGDAGPAPPAACVRGDSLASKSFISHRDSTQAVQRSLHVCSACVAPNGSQVAVACALRAAPCLRAGRSRRQTAQRAVRARTPPLPAPPFERGSGWKGQQRNPRRGGGATQNLAPRESQTLERGFVRTFFELVVRTLSHSLAPVNSAAYQGEHCTSLE